MKENSVKTASMPRRIFNTLILPVAMYAALCVINPGNFFKASSALLIITQCLPYLAIGWSMLFGMSVGLFDFSVGATIILAGLVGTQMSQMFGLAGFALGCIVASIILATLVGALYSFLRIPSIIAGFAGMLIYEAIGVSYSSTFKNAISTNNLVLGKSPCIYVVIIIMFAIVYLVFNNTKFGYQIKAIGGNEKVARSMGINSGKLKMITYVVGGIFLGISTILYVSNSGTVQAQQSMASMNICFTPMMGVMIGELLTSCNPVIGTFVGELCITIVSSGMVALGIESRLQNFVIGLFLIIFMTIQINKNSSFMKRLMHKKGAATAP